MTFTFTYLSLCDIHVAIRVTGHSQKSELNTLKTSLRLPYIVDKMSVHRLYQYVITSIRKSHFGLGCFL